MESMLMNPTVVDRLQMTRQRLYNPNYWTPGRGTVYPGDYRPPNPYDRPRRRPYKYPGYTGKPQGPRKPPVKPPVPAELPEFRPYTPKNRVFAKGLVELPIVPQQMRSRAIRQLLLMAARRLAPKLVPGLNIASTLMDAYSVAFAPGNYSALDKYAFGEWKFGAGWTLKCDIAPVVRGKATSTINPNLNCLLTTSDVPAGNYWDAIPANIRWVGMGPVNALLPPAQRVAHALQWIGAAVHDKPIFTRGFPNDPFADPFNEPVNPFDPEPAPFAQPAFQPAVPYRLLPLLRELPNHDPGYGFGPPVGYRGPPELPPPLRGPRDRSVAHDPDGPPHVVRPPGKGEKEKKPDFSRKKFNKAVKTLANAVTESNDWVDAVYKSLPGKVRHQYQCKTMQCKLNALYRHTNEINATKALVNIAQNDLTDRTLGMWGNLAKKAVRRNPYWVSPVGLQAGGRYRPQYRGE